MNFDEENAEAMDPGEARMVIVGICIALLALVGIAWTAVRFWQ